ncbi:hypothetical protein IGB42_02602 [Andreprevotia sp. IGB-42]|uniref:DUF4224 domain-containing protein n=1 Tax=Andreprevotia sp. IGB-42 TaxID=2497473 RepID=UPI0013579C6E|nr:DUF4224 domain-containing protein [Andreprevotia sp. IGB-42]KAF0812759.1 hypothetical protein IGB42_02602 [Andreprevotia sp. IGB-42]
MSTEPLFLNAEEVRELTGIAKGSRGKSRDALQVDWLRNMGIPFWLNAKGCPVVSRAAITGQPARKEQPTTGPWVPRVLSR